MDHVLRELCHKVKILHGHFPIILLYNAIVKKIGSNNMTLLYPNLCNNKVCYKVTAQYSSKKSISIKLSEHKDMDDLF